MRFLDLGRLDYRSAWDRQLAVHAEVSAGAEDTLIFVEHPPVLTLGANFHAENLNFSVEEIQARGIAIEPTDRGGDVTYHGPGQLVIYPIFDLNRHGKDLHRYLRMVEEALMLAVAEWGLTGSRKPPHTGVWLGDEKVAAIGIKVKRWVTLHGAALNLDLDLSSFEVIVPCGIHEFGVTSVSAATGRSVSVDAAKDPVIRAFSTVFRGT